MKPQIIILHGDGLSAISQKISQIKKDFDPVSTTSFSGKELGFDEALVKFSTPGLFSEKRLVILEDFDLTGGKVDLDKLPEEKELTVVLKASKELTQASVLLKQAKKLEAKIFLLRVQDEKSIFPFLDALAERKDVEAYSLFEKNYDAYGSQYLLTMIFYLLRKFVLKPKNLPGFVLQKMERHKRNFSQEKIKGIYLKVLETDFKIKSGLLEERMGMTLLIERILTI